MNLAIGITTTPDRHHVFLEILKKWKEFLPDHAAIYYSMSDTRVSVSENKNHILSMCAYADNIFMADDDIFPVCRDWWQPYTESPLNHACWNFNRRIINKGSIYWEFDKPNGCLLYFKKIAIDTVGGWDTDFKGYGYEHVSLSDRIYNNGLNPARYIDIPNSSELFELANCESSFNSDDRMQIPNNLKLYQEKYYSKEFKPFK